MNYKDLFQIAMQLISSPARAWEEIRLEEDRRKVFTAFVYPMIGLCGLSVFIGALLLKGWGGPQSFQYAMTQCCAVAVSLFGGYFLAAYLINNMCVRMLGMRSDIMLVQQFAGYALVVPFLLQIVIGVLPDFTIIAMLLVFYTVYIVWEGCKVLMQVEEKNQMKFTIISSALLIICPLVIQFVFNKLTVVLN
ncbi:Yip1 family protein [Mediterranea massiliensis]|uniref:Yip1 family protein n=1 Tax=Mediterranea massiliensis TaxID=1841865 RepID=UPI0025A3F9CE|nr:Yip1 family protein [Mediterranea massiliensis]MDM8337446.1 Yip1 family protein [Mediterranea massiliensis]